MERQCFTSKLRGSELPSHAAVSRELRCFTDGTKAIDGSLKDKPNSAIRLVMAVLVEQSCASRDP
jgi:hypothetical protein